MSDDKEKALADELSTKIQEILEHGDSELKEMVRETVRGLHNFMMEDPKSRADMKSKEKAIVGGKVIPFPNELSESLRTDKSMNEIEEPMPSESAEKNDSKRINPTILLIGFVLVLFLAFFLSRGGSGDGKWCNVKGNVNANGERIFHLPGDKWYEKTSVDETRGRGERWFCSEQSALDAGFRRAMH